VILLVLILIAFGIFAAHAGVALGAEPPWVSAHPMLVGLFGVAVALGTLGRLWSGPATLQSHLEVQLVDPDGSHLRVGASAQNGGSAAAGSRLIP
jgi:hypothetical protein